MLPVETEGTYSIDTVLWARACEERLSGDGTARDARALLGGGYRDTIAKKGINILLSGISAMNEDCRE